MACGAGDLRADDAALIEKSLSVKSIAAAPKEGEQLVDCIVATLQPHGWEAVGGRSTIKWRRGELVVSAPDLVQAQITMLVDALSQLPPARAKEAAATPKLLRVDLGDRDADVPTLSAVYPVADLLRGPGAAPDVQDQIVEVIRSTVAPATWSAVGGDGQIEAFQPRGALIVSRTKEVHEQVESLLAALRNTPVIRNADLDKPPKAAAVNAGAYRVEDTELVTVIYPVADLVTDGKSAQLPAAKRGWAAKFDFESMEELITSSIAPATWDTVGGSGAIKEYDPRFVLVISQSKEVHKLIESLFAALRKLPRYSTRPKRAAPVPPTLVGTSKFDGGELQIVVYDVAGRVAGRPAPDFDSLIEQL